MNIEDVKEVPPFTSGVYPEVIFDRQSKLESYYHTIEKRKGKLFSVNSRDGQIHIKDFLWRITEELGEYLEAHFYEANQWKCWEELADGLHFVTGLCVTLDMRKEFVEGWVEAPAAKISGGYILEPTFLILIEKLGTLGNMLKLKPWKQTEVLTDEVKFRSKLKDMVYAYVDFCRVAGLNKDQLFNLYYRKSEVNFFRIRSQY